MAKQPKRAGIKKVIFENSLLGGGEGSYEGRTPIPLSRLSLESGSTSTWGQVEDAFFERGVEEEREAMALYAKLPESALKEPRRLPFQPKHLFWTGCAAIVVVASVIIVSRLTGGSARDTVAISEPAPVVAAPPSAAPVAAPALPAPQEIPAPAQAAAPAETVAPAAIPPAQAAPNPAQAVAPVEAVAPAVGEKRAMPENLAVETKPVAAPVAVEKNEAKVAPVAVERAEPVVAEKAVEKSAPAAVEEKPVAGDADVALCRIGLEKKQSRSINEACAAALSTDKSLASPLLKWTRGEFERGRTGIASTWASRIIAVDPDQADAYVIIGVAEQTAKRIPAARTAYKRYLELAPRGAFARDVRSALATM